MHIPKRRRHFLMRKPWFALLCFTLCLFFRCFMILWVMFSIFALLLSSHYAYVLDMYTSLCHCALLVACLDDHLFFYMIIVVISYDCFVFDQVTHMFHNMFTWSFLLVTLYLSFYHLIYLDNLMCFMQSVSGYRYACSKFIIGFRFRYD